MRTLEQFEKKKQMVMIEKKIKQFIDEADDVNIYFGVSRKDETSKLTLTIKPDAEWHFFSYNISIWKNVQIRDETIKISKILDNKHISEQLCAAIYELEFSRMSEVQENLEIYVAVSYQQNYLMNVVKKDRLIDDELLMREAIDCLALKYNMIK